MALIECLYRTSQKRMTYNQSSIIVSQNRLLKLEWIVIHTYAGTRRAFVMATAFGPVEEGSAADTVLDTSILTMGVGQSMLLGLCRIETQQFWAVQIAKRDDVVRKVEEVKDDRLVMMCDWPLSFL